jgi:hypothetical protein
MGRGLLGVLALLTACGSDTPEEPELAPWSPELPGAGEAMGERRGLIPARGIIHLHSPYSHDACDGEPRDEDTGELDEACLADLRAALCAARVDYAALTEHDDSMADEAFEDLLLARGGDQRVGPANLMTCDNGHTALMMTGGENDLMPVMIDRHPDGTVEERHAAYNAEDPATVALFRDIGGLVVIPHAESRDLERIRGLAPDGMEIYNLHANIDPDIREEFLGLPAAGAIQEVVEFADTTEEGAEPDLALMSFLEPSNVAIDRWDALLGEGMRIFGTAGTDAHQNALPILLKDGERGDSYRRMIYWFANVALADDPDDPAAIEAAVAAGRSFVAFEVFGTPAGFDVFAGDGSAAVGELGDEVSAGVGLQIEVAVPSVYQLDPALPAPEIRARILRIDAAGVTEVAAGPGPSLAAPLDAPGAYRVEVLITPHHRGPYLRRLGTTFAEREQVWIYANPIYVR